MPLVTDLNYFFDEAQAKFLGCTAALSLTATGNNSQADAYALTENYNQFTTVTGAANSAKLMDAESAAYNGCVFVRNDDSADNLNLFPASGDSFNALSANAAIVVPFGCAAFLVKVSITQWLAVVGLGADLLALENLSTTGLLARTGAGAYSTRTITGTADVIDLSNGDGVSGNPTIDISNAWRTGWQKSEDDWTYASATTVTSSIDPRTIYEIGDRIRLVNNSTTKYFYIVGLTDTVVTLWAGSSYTIANSAITNLYFSKSENPIGFPYAFPYTATLTGFSADPASPLYFGRMHGKWMCIDVRLNNAGTSNATTFTISLPVTAATVSNMNWQAGTYDQVNNSVNSTVPGLARISSAGTVVNLFLDISGTGWTAALDKRASFSNLCYPVST